MNNYIYIGKIVNTHGTKGELRVLSDFKYKDYIFKPNFEIYVGDNKIKEMITSYRHHKSFEMIMLSGYSNINEVLKYKGQKVYIKKEDLNLREKDYLDEDLIGFMIIADNKEMGKLVRIDKYPTYNMLVIMVNGKEVLVPKVTDFISKIDISNKKIVINNIKGLIE